MSFLTNSRWKTPCSRFSFLLMLGVMAFAVVAAGLQFSGLLYRWVETEYGAAARDRVIQLEQLIAQDAALAEPQKLERVNRFFNRLDYRGDAALWNQKDYWATPFEVLGINSADCEDYALSKYFTLLSLGVAEEKLRITYVQALELEQAHMVLAYYPSAKAEPLILDNLVDAIRPASERTDLSPVYSFNGADLWLAVNRVEGRKIGRADQVSRWQAFQSRLREQMGG